MPELDAYWDIFFEHVLGLLTPYTAADDDRIDDAPILAARIADRCVVDFMAFTQNKSVAELAAEVMAQDNSREDHAG